MKKANCKGLRVCIYTYVHLIPFTRETVYVYLKIHKSIQTGLERYSKIFTVATNS